MHSCREISWWVPVTSQLKLAKLEFRRSFPLQVILRLTTACVVVFALVALCLPRWIPDLQFDWARGFVQCMAALAAIILACFVIMMVPPRVTVTAGNVVVQQGQSCRRFRRQDLAELRLVEGGGVCPILLLRTRSRNEPRLYPVARRVCLVSLRRLIAEPVPGSSISDHADSFCEGNRV